MLFPDEGSIALKELSAILDVFLARRHRPRFGGFGIRELLRNPRDFAVEARLIPRRRLAFKARIALDKDQMDSFELVQPNLTRGFRERGARTEGKSDCTDRGAGQCQKKTGMFEH